MSSNYRSGIRKTISCVQGSSEKRRERTRGSEDIWIVLIFYYYSYWVLELMRALFQLQCRMTCQIKRLNENFEQAQLRIMGLTTQVQALRRSTSSTGEGDADPTETECLCKSMFENPWRPTNCTNFSLIVICSLTELPNECRKKGIECSFFCT